MIAILATATIVAYRGVQGRAYAATARADFSTIVKKTELYKIDTVSGTYPYNIASMQSADIEFSKNAYNAVIWCSTGAASTPMWGVVADVKDGKTYEIDSVNKTFSEFTQNTVANNSGGVTCPALGIGANVWSWILQPGVEWSY